MKLYISKNLDFDENKTRLSSEFTLFCAEHLPIEDSFEIHLVTNRDQHGISTTALYEVGNNICKIYSKNRAFVDILRSIAHEMTHMMQDEMGLLTGNIRDAGGFHEDQANAKAGELIKLFAKSKKDRKAIYESKKIKEEGVRRVRYVDSSGLDLNASIRSNPDFNPAEYGDLNSPDPDKNGVNKWVYDFINAMVKKFGPSWKPTSVYRGPGHQSSVSFGYVYVKDMVARLYAEENNMPIPAPGAYYFAKQPDFKKAINALKKSGMTQAGGMVTGVYYSGGPKANNEIASAFRKYQAADGELKRLYKAGNKDQRSLRNAARETCGGIVKSAIPEWTKYQKRKVNQTKPASTHMTGRAIDFKILSEEDEEKLIAFAKTQGVIIKDRKTRGGVKYESDHFHIPLYKA